MTALGSTSRDTSRRLAERQQDLPSQARLLVERQRAGELEPAALELAAWVGDPAATLALDAPPPRWDDAERFSHGLEELGGRAALGRFGLVLIQALIEVPPAKEGLHEFEEQEARSYVATALCPCPEHVHGFRPLCTPQDATPDLLSARALLLLGAEGLAATLSRVSAPRRARLQRALGLGGRAVAGWALWGDDPLRRGWATGFCRSPLDSLPERLAATRRLKPADAFYARRELATEVLDPEWGELIEAWEDAQDPREIELSIRDWIEWRSEEPFQTRSDPAGMWQAYLEHSRFGPDETRAHLLQGRNVVFDYTWEF